MSEKGSIAKRNAAVPWRSIAGACAIGVLAGGWVIGARAFAPTGWGGRPAAPSLVAELNSPADSRPGFAKLVETVKPAVIGVKATMAAQVGEGRAQGSPFEEFFHQHGAPGDTPDGLARPHRRRVMTAQGSGFFISADGYIVTNNHVVEGTSSAEIETEDHQTYTARVVGSDAASDLALLKIDGRDGFRYVKFAERAPDVGDWVVAIGNPFGLGGTVTAGIVSARERNIGTGKFGTAHDGTGKVGTSSLENLVQIDAPVNKGDSGGPSFDSEGNVIGVNTMIFSPSGGSIGIAFAIPADTVKRVIAQLRDKGSVTRGWLGVEIQNVTPDLADGLGLNKAEGALVTEPMPGSPAAKSGMASGDVITSLDGQPIKDDHALSRQLTDLAPGTNIAIGILRSGREQTISVTLGDVPAKRTAPSTVGQASQAAAADPPSLGLTLAPAASVPGLGSQGVVVTDIDPDGRGAGRVEAGDVILEVSGKPVRTPDEVKDAVAGARNEGKRTILMRLKSGDTTRFVAVPANPA
jgi:serine protease Do